MRKIVCLLAVVAFGLGACTDSHSRAARSTISPRPSESFCDIKCQPQPLHIPVHGTPVGSSTSSIIENLPVPKTARLVESDSAGYDRDAWYELPEEITVDDLVAWFQRRVPPYHHWHSWRWCTGVHNTDPYSSQGFWSWNKGTDGMQTLRTVIMEYDGKAEIHFSLGSTGLCGNG